MGFTSRKQSQCRRLSHLQEAKRLFTKCKLALMPRNACPGCLSLCGTHSVRISSMAAFSHRESMLPGKGPALLTCEPAGMSNALLKLLMRLLTLFRSKTALVLQQGSNYVARRAPEMLR